MVYQAAWRVLGNVHDTEDAVQDAYLKLREAGVQPDSEEAYLFRVTANVCVDKLRRERVRRQAAVYLSKHARSVHILVRGPGLTHSMSDYLIQRIDRIPNVHLHPHTEVQKI